MNNDLIIILKELKKVKRTGEIERVISLTESLLRKEKREAILLLLGIAEEFGHEEIITSYLEIGKIIPKAKGKKSN